mgnify:CR=1 FL=1
MSEKPNPNDPPDEGENPPNEGEIPLDEGKNPLYDELRKILDSIDRDRESQGKENRVVTNTDPIQEDNATEKAIKDLSAMTEPAGYLLPKLLQMSDKMLHLKDDDPTRQQWKVLMDQYNSVFNPGLNGASTAEQKVAAINAFLRDAGSFIKTNEHFMTIEEES